MGRKGKRHSTRNQNSNPHGKLEIAKLLDTRRAHHKESGKETTKHESTLEKQFEPLFEKFQIPQDSSSSQVVVYDDEAEPGEVPPMVEEVDEDENNQKDRLLSKRKLRKVSKPTLYELKKSVPYPQVIEWYDRDSQYPYLQASIKSSKNMVPVPSHWQNKKEYLSGRSLLEKRPFELPEIIKETDIEQMRQVMPDETKDSTLKETARARVQPKVGTLDIDYKKLHDVFFKLGTNWKPDVLLPFGDLYYEGRNLYEEAQWKKLVRDKKPGKISAELRSIMNLGEGQLPPWCMKMKNAGMPPSYPNLKVAGLNWGIENLKGDTYGTLSTQQGTKDKTKYFGQMILLDEPEQEEIEDQSEGLVYQDDAAKVEQKDNNTQAIEAPIEIEPQEASKEPDEAPRPLFTIMKEKKSDTASDTTGSRTIYAISNNDKEAEEPSKSKQDSNEEDRQDHIENFKF
ncbi:hypothetical protein ZYGR_0U01650 [Zygosaccharomyces rouxii]|uniref:ZYRO0F12386p n=2 Tax=Zygosaccharomyces rouxii TaxID=4956 RepID=C5DYE5_ZYGRC|nr:uncharacterized protein ZYRO0F12386g [Zygosaccharomyces rouxii]KAH9199564.1 hypothetical protein LQ764DRAFT_131806 [Zygosaccharomyces rouxii]GAV50309.1 hypothetical protein ZYGR_0U01650 [Zygosaccharomyces rouxii]CAR28806.1 ZYRO0F12386p [Zygosaccharomyces rouxii]